MNNTFSKKNLPLIEKVVHGNCEPREYWSLMRTMQDKSGMTHQVAPEHTLLQHGASLGDIWSACQLARSYFSMAEATKNCEGDAKVASSTLFAQALSYWVRAARVGDDGACWDLKHRELRSHIDSFKTGEGAYADIEMKCALLTEYILTDFGMTSWESLTPDERIARCECLVREVMPVLGIDTPILRFVDGLTLGGREVDGTAGYYDNLLQVRGELINNYERLIQVLFHELGHFVVFAMWNGAEPNARRLRDIYNISDKQASHWYDDSYLVDGLPQTERDPDTLSYGVYTDWAILFA